MKKNIQQRRLEFLEEEVKYYSEDTSRRAIDELKHINSTGTYQACRYKSKDGKKCAIGRHVIDDLYSESMEGHSISSYGQGARILNSLPKEISELGVEFLSDCQRLHDSKMYWDDNKLSRQGEDFSQVIKEKYCK